MPWRFVADQTVNILFSVKHGETSILQVRRGIPHESQARPFCGHIVKRQSRDSQNHRRWSWASDTTDSTRLVVRDVVTRYPRVVFPIRESD